MKTWKSTLQMEALEGRSMLSANPWGGIAAPVPEPEAVTVRRWERLTVPVTDDGNSAPSIVGHTTISNPSATASDSLKYNFGGIEGAAGCGMQSTEQGVTGM